MNTKRLNINKILLGALIFAVSIQAADKNDLKNNEQQNRAREPKPFLWVMLPQSSRQKVLSLPHPQNRRADKSLAF